MMQTLRWLRVIGDTIFATGCVSLVVFVVGLSTGHSYLPERIGPRRAEWPAADGVTVGK